MTLVILAAGMASRYGGLKQADAFGKNGEFIIDYSIYDAMQAGFDKVVLIIREEHLEIFKSTLEKRVGGKIKIEYVFQKSDNVPAPYNTVDRKKPWGTCHALMCCKDIVDDDFAVINADDFYGRDAFVKVSDFLRVSGGDYCMAGYVLKNTLSKNGQVTRGICDVKDGMLCSVLECKGIIADGAGAAYVSSDGTKTALDKECIVSMNFWGFRKSVFGLFGDKFANFLRTSDEITTDEYCISTAVDDSIRASQCNVKVLRTDAKWLGVTYASDKEAVQNSLRELVDNKIYPEKLF